LSHYLPGLGQPIPGPHPGEGRIDAAERWLTAQGGTDGETEAAAMLATIAAVANIRMVSFIFGQPLGDFQTTRKNCSEDIQDTCSPTTLSRNSSVSSKSWQ
jgi:hypothetical protein